MTANNIWLGGNELVILFKNGTHIVIESYEDGNTVFVGRYEDCIKYCEERWVEYQESLY